MRFLNNDKVWDGEVLMVLKAKINLNELIEYSGAREDPICDRSSNLLHLPLEKRIFIGNCENTFETSGDIIIGYASGVEYNPVP